MAGDWIKMRVSLTRDPRVIRMADWLAAQADFVSWLTTPTKESCVTSAYSHVTRHVTVALCVTALLVTWGTAREQGDRDGDDLILSQCDLETISAMSDMPCFGHAMSLVGWAKQTDDGSVMFPKFFRENESPEEKHKRQAAERQARKREKDRLEAEEKARNSNVTSHVTNNVTDDVTVTHREEKRREEKDINTSSVSDDGFDEFWTLWPRTDRKTAKSKCKERWVKAKLSLESAAIHAHVKEMKVSNQQWKTGYEPAPLTYLNQRRWDDGASDGPDGSEWWLLAGFENEWDAMNAGCTEHNARFFKDGVKIKGEQ